MWCNVQIILASSYQSVSYYSLSSLFLCFQVKSIFLLLFLTILIGHSSCVNVYPQTLRLLLIMIIFLYLNLNPQMRTKRRGKKKRMFVFFFSFPSFIDVFLYSMHRFSVSFHSRPMGGRRCHHPARQVLHTHQVQFQ